MSILVTGATGVLGSQIADFLRQWIDPKSIISTSRSESNRSQVEAKGVQFRVLDYQRPETLAPAFKGVEKALLIPSRDYDTEKRGRELIEAIKAAVEAGVKHIYLVSAAFGGYGRSDQYIMKGNLMAEDFLKTYLPFFFRLIYCRQNVTWTILRHGGYSYEFLKYIGFGPDMQAVYLPGEGPTGFTTESNLAEGTARMLIDNSSKYDNKTVLLTNTKLATFSDAVKLGSQILKRDIPVHKVSLEQYAGVLTSYGVPDWAAPGMAEMFVGMEQGELETTSSVLEELLGRKPTTLDEVVRDILKA